MFNLISTSQILKALTLNRLKSFRADKVVLPYMMGSKFGKVDGVTMDPKEFWISSEISQKRKKNRKEAVMFWYLPLIQVSTNGPLDVLIRERIQAGRMVVLVTCVFSLMWQENSGLTCISSAWDTGSCLPFCLQSFWDTLTGTQVWVLLQAHLHLL